MTVQAAVKPDTFDIVPRNRHFDVAAVAATDWHGGSAVRTALFNALSLMFPVGEQYFIDSVKHFRDGVTDPGLLNDIKGFTVQEAIHSREHRHYNEAVCAAAGLSVEELEAPIQRRIRWARKYRKPIELLAMTVAYEHLTAILADAMFRNESALAGAHPDMADLWRWHGLEETEHKAVAFDVYVACGGTVAMRRRAMLVVTVNIVRDLIRNMRYLLRNRPLTRRAIWGEALAFLFGRDGAMRGLWAPYRNFFRRSFHPWDHPGHVAAALMRAEERGAVFL